MSLVFNDFTPSPDRGANAATKRKYATGAWRIHFPRAALAAVAVLAVSAVVNPHLASSRPHSLWIASVALSLAVAMLTWSLSRRHAKCWLLPLRDFTTLIREIRSGDAPIEELAQVRGNLQPLAAEVNELLRDLRRQRQAVADLNLEVEERIANRTSALERLVGILRHQAKRDPVSQLCNRQALDEALPQLIRQGAQDPKGLAVLALDVQHLQDVISALGQEAADTLMRSLGQIIRSTIREGDMGFRYGFDRFVVLLPGCSEEPARRVGQRLQSLAQSLAATFNVLRQRPDVALAVTTTVDFREPTAEAMLHRADEQLRTLRLARQGAVPAMAGA